VIPFNTFRGSARAIYEDNGTTGHESEINHNHEDTLRKNTYRIPTLKLRPNLRNITNPPAQSPNYGVL